MTKAPADPARDYIKQDDTILPDLPGAALMRTLRDLAAVERDPRYTVAMQTWHQPTHLGPNNSPLCSVCLGGAVLARRFDLPDEHMEPTGVLEDPHEVRKIYGLDDLRVGNIAGFLRYFGRSSEECDSLESGFLQHLSFMTGAHRTAGTWLPPYDSDPVVFKERLMLLSYYLTAQGH